MQFNVVLRTGGLAINRKNRGKRGVRRHNSHKLTEVRIVFFRKHLKEYARTQTVDIVE